MMVFSREMFALGEYTLQLVGTSLVAFFLLCFVVISRLTRQYLHVISCIIFLFGNSCH